MPLKKVQSGQQLKIPAATFNAMVDAAVAHRESQRDTSRHSRQSFKQAGIALIRNESNVEIPRFGILGIDGVIIEPASNLDEFQSNFALSGVVPKSPLHFGQFAISKTPLPPGEIGKAVFDGLSPARVEITDACHQFAEVKDEEAGLLVSQPFGAARILWREGGLGTQWAIVRLSNSGHDIQRFKLVSPLARCGTADALRLTFSESSQWEQDCGETDCPFELHDALGIAKNNAEAGAVGWAKWQADSQRWELLQLGEDCCDSSSSSEVPSSSYSSDSSSSESSSSESSSSESSSSESSSSESSSSEYSSSSSWSSSDYSSSSSESSSSCPSGHGITATIHTLTPCPERIGDLVRFPTQRLRFECGLLVAIDDGEPCELPIRCEPSSSSSSERSSSSNSSSSSSSSQHSSSESSSGESSSSSSAPSSSSSSSPSGSSSANNSSSQVPVSSSGDPPSPSTAPSSSSTSSSSSSSSSASSHHSSSSSSVPLP